MYWLSDAIFQNAKSFVTGPGTNVWTMQSTSYTAANAVLTLQILVTCNVLTEVYVDNVLVVLVIV